MCDKVTDVYLHLTAAVATICGGRLSLLICHHDSAGLVIWGCCGTPAQDAVLPTTKLFKLLHGICD